MRPFFFPFRRRLLFNRPQPTDLRTGSQKLTSKLLEFPEFLDFSLRLLDRRRSRQRFRDGLAIDLIGQPEIGAVTRLAGLMTATVRLPAPTRRAGYAAGAKIAELRDALSNHFT